MNMAGLKTVSKYVPNIDKKGWLELTVLSHEVPETTSIYFNTFATLRYEEVNGAIQCLHEQDVITSFPQATTSGAFEVTSVGLANSQGTTNNTIISEQTARPIIYEASKSKMQQFILMTNIIHI